MCGPAKSTKEICGSFFLPGAGPHSMFRIKYFVSFFVNFVEEETHETFS